VANSLYAGYKQVQVGDAAITGFSVVNWESDDCRCILIDSADDTLNVNTDQDLADIAGAARVAVSGAMASKTAVLSSNTVTMDAADVTLSAVSGDQSEQVVIYRHTGTEATSLLIAFFDTFTSGMPVTPNGGDIVIQWNASGIFNW